MVNTIGICIIATNKYKDYAADLIDSIFTNFANKPIHILLSTDDIPFFTERGYARDITYFSVPNLVWPDIVNQRYKLLLRMVENEKFMGYLYLDADTLISKLTFEELVSVLSDSGMCFVCHPGFWRDPKNFFDRFLRYCILPVQEFFLNISFVHKTITYLSPVRNYHLGLIYLVQKKIMNAKIGSFSAQLLFLRFAYLVLKPFASLNYLQLFTKNVFSIQNIFNDYSRRNVFKQFLSEVYGILTGLCHAFNSNCRGTWEVRSNLRAFVPLSKRINYVCGGVWFGQRDDFVTFCRTANNWISEDLKLGFQARWFDESYANAYASLMPNCKKLHPGWAWTNQYSNVSDFKPLISLVQKDNVLPVQER